MSQVRLHNNSGRNIKAGELVRVDPADNSSFLIAKLTDFGIIGSVASDTLAGQFCLINLIGTVNYRDVIGAPASSKTNPQTTVDWSEITNKPDYLGAKITFSPTQPVNPIVNEIWIQTN